MNNKYLIKISIILKSLFTLMMLISFFLLIQEILVLRESSFQENNKLIENQTEKALGMFFITIPLLLSIFIDVKELKESRLKGKWIFVFLLIILSYALIFTLKEKWIGYTIPICLIGIFSGIIFKPERS